MGNKTGIKPMLVLLAVLAAVIGLSDIKVMAEKKGYWSTENAPEFYGTTAIVLKVNDTFDLKDTRYRLFAKDFEDFDLSGEIKADHNVNTSQAGNYEIHYSVTDSHNNTTTLTVPVTVSVDPEVKPMVERTLYSLPSVDNISAMGIGRGDSHDRQMMGIFVKAGATIEVRKLSGATATFTMLNNDSRTEASRTINTDWQEITFENDYVPFIKTLRKQNVKMVVQIRWDHADTGVRELNYLLDGDDEATFQEKWAADTDAYAVVEGEALTVLIPYADKDKLINYYRKHHKSYAAFFSYWKQVTDTYDKMLGLKYAPENLENQNSKSKFFVRANANGGGAAYYAGDHVGVNSPSVASFFELNWGGLHEFGHGYQGTLGKGDLSIGEVSNNIFGYYIQTNKAVYPYADNWLGELSKIEEGHNKKNDDGTVFASMDVTAKLYFIINMLESFEGPDTYAKIATLYRHNVMNGNPMDTQDAWALGIYESYGVNIIPYFKSWGIEVSESTKLTINSGCTTSVYALMDIVKDADRCSQVKTDLGLSLNYTLVSNTKLQSYGLTGNAEITLAINDINKLKDKYVQLKDGSRVIATAKITGNKITFMNIPIGAYQVSIPSIIGEYEVATEYVAITPAETKAVTIPYTKTAAINDNDVKIHFTGTYYNDACVIALRKQETGMNLHFEFRPRGLPNGGISADAIYISIIVRDTAGNEVYRKVVKKSEYFTLQSLELFDLEVKEGYTLHIMSHHGASRVLFNSTLNGDNRLNYQLDNGIEGTYVITEQGIMPSSMSKQDYMENEYQARLKAYIDAFVGRITEEELYSRQVYLKEKGIIVRGYQMLSAEDKKNYESVYQAITRGHVPVITVPNKNIQLIYNQKVDLASFISANDYEDGNLDAMFFDISYEYDVNKRNECNIIYKVSDTDGNIVTASIHVDILNMPAPPTVQKPPVITVGKVVGLKEQASATNTITLSWNKVNGATGYEVYRYNTKTKKYDRVATTKTNSVKISKLSAGTSYQFKVRAYKTVAKKNYYGSYTSAVTAITKPNKANLTEVKSKAKKKVTVSVKSVAGATGYQMEYSTSNKFTKNVTKTKTTKKRTETLTNLTSKKTYYVRVRAYKTVGKRTVYGAWSTVKKVVVK